jgi:hypothetical protein
VLERTLGVPIFQEQVMQLAIVAAGFTPARPTSCAARWRRGSARAGSSRSRQAVDGMLERGYEREFAEQIFQQIQGFGEYGFPESHAASFALLVYVSAGSSATSPRPSPARCSTASRWASTRRRSWCRTRAARRRGAAGRRRGQRWPACTAKCRHAEPSSPCPPPTQGAAPHNGSATRSCSRCCLRRNWPLFPEAMVHLCLITR